MTPEQIAALEASAADAQRQADENPADESLKTAAQKAADALSNAKAPSQTALESELEKANKGKRSKVDKLLYSKRRIEEQLAELGGGDQPEPTDEDDNKPVTVGMLKKIRQDESKKTSLEMAENITDAKERELVVHYLKTKVVPSDDPSEDLRFALAAVNSLKNAQIASELGRKTNPKTYSSAPGSSARVEEPFEPTPEEAAYMKPPFNLSKEKILQARGEGK